LTPISIFPAHTQTMVPQAGHAANRAPYRYTRRRAFKTRRSHPLSSLLPIAVSFLGVEVSADAPFQTNVFVGGRDGYHTYRIPAVLVSPKGALLAFCEGRKTGGGDHGDLDLVLKRSDDGGKTWGPMTVVHEEGGNAKITIGNPCPVVDRDTGTIWLPFCRDNDDVFMTHSTDDGHTWAAPTEITADVKKPTWSWYATGPGVGIQLRRGPHAGRMVIPCDHREPIDGEQTMLSHAFYSDDHGKRWKLGSSVGLHTDECQVVETADGSLLMNMRNDWVRSGKQPDQGQMRTVSRSTDGGASWSALRFEKTLVEPVCQASFLRYTDEHRHDRNRVLFSNPPDATRRINLTVRLSYDEGETWPVARRLWAGPSAYSCLTVLPDLSIGCLYEAGNERAYETIRFARFSLDWLTRGRDPGRRP
jgi:sialidase-1